MQYHFSGFCGEAQRALNDAIALARSTGAVYVGTEHALAAVAMHAVAASVLASRGVTARTLRAQLAVRGVPVRLTPEDFTSALGRCVDDAVIEAQTLHAKRADVMHLLCALLEGENSGAVAALRAAGAQPAACLRECQRVTGHAAYASAQSPTPHATSKNAEKYVRDMTRMAEDGLFDPVFGREQELARVEQILLRRRKNNPCLVGEPGVGKTAVAEALAQSIADGTAPQELCGHRLLSLDVASLVAGTKYRGDFEERFRTVLSELMHAGNAVLFIDEVHSIAGAGAAEGGIDAGNILKPILARGELRVIGATTRAEYRRTIEKDAALARRFGCVDIAEPDDTTALAILRGLAPRYEHFHGVTLAPDACEAAVRLSRRYLPERRLPDKAIDLMDEACVAVRANAPQTEERPPLCVTAEAIARVCAQQSGVPAEKLCAEQTKKLAALETTLAQQVMGQQAAVRAVAAALRRAQLGFADAHRPMAAFLLLGPTGVGKTSLARALASCCFGSEAALARFDMSEYMERHTVSRLLGAPPGYVGHGEGGQLTEAVRRRPYCVLLFDEMEKAHPDVSNLLLQILEDGRLTDSEGVAVDFSITLVLLTSNLGAKAFCGAGQLGFGGAARDAERRRRTAAEQTALRAARDAFRPELLGRLDAMLVFHPLGEQAMRDIARKLLCDAEQRCKAAGVTLAHTQQAVALMARNACMGAYGARELRRAVTQQVEQPLADAVLHSTCRNYQLCVHSGKLEVRARMAQRHCQTERIKSKQAKGTEK